MHRGQRSFAEPAALFRALVDNGFEFLEKAIDEFEVTPRFSVIHFAIATELFLKAKLLSEHWSLLLDLPDRADKEAFFRGETKTAALEQIITRLEKVASVSIGQNAKEAFIGISRHRNRIVHFAHVDIVVQSTEQQKKSLAEEQVTAWYHLGGLLAQWKEFSSDNARISQMRGKMEKQNLYLKQIFEAKMSLLKSFRAAGGAVLDCPICGFEAVKLSAITESIFASECCVCSYRGRDVKLVCPHEACNQMVYLSSYNGLPAACTECHQQIKLEDVSEALDTGEGVHPDNYMDWVPISCPECSGYHTVVEHHEIYVCAQCFETSEDFGICGNCAEGQLGGVPEHSSLAGCAFCDGSWRED